MAKFHVQVRNEESTEVIEGVTVTVKYLDWLNNEQIAQEITNAVGWANFDIGATNANIQIEAKHKGSIDKGSTFADLFGNVQDDHITLNLSFKPFESTKDTFEDLYETLKENAKLATITISITAVIALAIWAKSATNPKIPKIPKVENPIDIKSDKEDKE